MDIELASGSYIVAVSGGVDSVVLLDMLLNATYKTSTKLVVAHFDHGIRDDSAEDRAFVETLAKKHDLKFVSGEGKLGTNSSEETARKARYCFLNKVRQDYQARAIILAHHQDDLLETMILNIIRGTSRRGLTSLRSTDELIRPLLNTPKSKLIEYAKAKGLNWREDSSNNNPKYTRNYIRAKLIPRLDKTAKQTLLAIIVAQIKINDQADQLVNQLLKTNLVNNQLPRLWLASVDQTCGRELIAGWLRLNEIYGYNQNILNRLNTELRVAKVSSLIDVTSGWQIVVNKDNLALAPIER